jgi:hypothetical protein
MTRGSLVHRLVHGSLSALASWLGVSRADCQDASRTAGRGEGRMPRRNKRAATDPPFARACSLPAPASDAYANAHADAPHTSAPPEAHVLPRAAGVRAWLGGGGRGGVVGGGVGGGGVAKRQRVSGPGGTGGERYSGGERRKGGERHTGLVQARCLSWTSTALRAHGPEHGNGESESRMQAPEAGVGLDRRMRDGVCRQVPVLALRLPSSECGAAMQQLSAYVLRLPRIKAVIPDPSPRASIEAPTNTKLILIQPDGGGGAGGRGGWCRRK